MDDIVLSMGEWPNGKKIYQVTFGSARFQEREQKWLIDSPPISFAIYERGKGLVYKDGKKVDLDR